MDRDPTPPVTRSRLLIALASVFAGLAAVLVAAASVYRTPVPLVVAVPLGLTGALLWYHGTGRLGDRLRARARAQARGESRDRTRGPRSRARGGARTGPGGRRATGTDYDRARGRRRARAPDADAGPSAAEAYRVLGVDPGADEERIRRAYRERAKATHPDAASGDEEEFKRVNAAYERLVD